MRSEIKAANGSEVLFLGIAKDEITVSDIRVLARGNDWSAPAITREVKCGDVLIHNHPTGSLKPSDADVGVASHTGNLGAGFYIVNNPVDDLYVVVPPYRDEKITPLDPDDTLAHLLPGSPLSTAMSGYEERSEQVEMASKVVDAFNSDGIALVEAGTGVGKSMAYLVPAILWSIKNSERVAISTNTINLQEQLIFKDIPFLRKHLGVDFKAVLVKGRGNYACRRKASTLKAEGNYLFEDDTTREQKALFEWIGTTREGSRSDLSFIPTAPAWEKVASEADLCLRAKCHYYNECFFYRARREAASSNLLIANHHLLFADIAVKGERGNFGDSAVMPPYPRVIIDEAHNLEEIATEYFGMTLSRRGLLLLLGRLWGTKRKKRGLLPYLHSKFLQRKKQLPEKLVSTGLEAIEEAGRELEKIRGLTAELFDFAGYVLLDNLKEETSGREKREGKKVRLDEALKTSEGWRETEGKVRLFLEEGRFLSKGLVKIGKILLDLPEKERVRFEPQQMELNAYSDRFAGYLASLETFFFQEPEEAVKWVDLAEGDQGTRVKLNISPLSVAGRMKSHLYDSFKTVVLTSATLSVGGSFDYTAKRLGLEAVSERTSETRLDSPFDFKRQAFIGIPTDLPTPTENRFSAELESLVTRSLVTSDGRAFVLFTSYRMLNDLFAKASRNPELKSYTLFKQGDEPRHSLLEKFKKDKHSVIFGSDSFWEGVDVPGEALMSVILTKLPFSVPDDPVIEARTDAINRAGGNSFMDYIVPMAALRFRQGFGRLIRNKSDRGAILITDSRIVRKGYGNVFLKSLPPCDIFKGPAEAVLKHMSEFFKGFEKR